MKTKAIQYFNNDYLQKCKGMTAEQILFFLEDFRLLHKDAVEYFIKAKAEKIAKMNLQNF